MGMKEEHNNQLQRNSFSGSSNKNSLEFSEPNCDDCGNLNARDPPKTPSFSRPRNQGFSATQDSVETEETLGQSRDAWNDDGCIASHNSYSSFITEAYSGRSQSLVLSQEDRRAMIEQLVKKKKVVKNEATPSSEITTLLEARLQTHHNSISETTSHDSVASKEAHPQLAQTPHRRAFITPQRRSLQTQSSTEHFSKKERRSRKMPFRDKPYK